MKALINKYNYLAILSIFGLIALVILGEVGFIDKEQPEVYIQVLGIVCPLIVVPYSLYLFYDCLINPEVETKVGWVVMFLFFAPITAVVYSKSKAYKEQSTMLEQLKIKDN